MPQDGHDLYIVYEFGFEIRCTRCNSAWRVKDKPATIYRLAVLALQIAVFAFSVSSPERLELVIPGYGLTLLLPWLINVLVYLFLRRADTAFLSRLRGKQIKYDFQSHCGEDQPDRRQENGR